MLTMTPSVCCVSLFLKYTFLLFISTSIEVLLIHLLEIDDFEKKSVEFALKMGILLAFQN